MRPYLSSIIVISIALAGCSPSPRGGDLTVSGRVADDVVTLDTPRVTTSTPSLTSVGAVAVVVGVSRDPGDQVSAGDEVVVFDDRLLKAGVRSARASVRVARARVGVLENMRSDIDEQKTTVAQTRTQLGATIAELQATLGDLKARRVEAAASLEELRRLLRTLPPGATQPPAPSTPPSAPPPAGPGGGGGSQGGLPKPEDLERAIARLDGAITRLEGGLSRARTGLSRLNTASAKLSDASASVSDAIEFARIAADASESSVRLAQEQLASAVLRAPVDAIVIEVPEVGETLAFGATAVRLRTRSEPRIEAWLGFEDLERVRLEGRARVRIDSLPGREFEAVVSRIGESAQYPPTYVATREVHLGRAVRVQLAPVGATEESGVGLAEASWPALPPGTPCDITFVERSARR